MDGAELLRFAVFVSNLANVRHATFASESC